jgi:hypothetical protein
MGCQCALMLRLVCSAKSRGCFSVGDCAFSRLTQQWVGRWEYDSSCTIMTLKGITTVTQLRFGVLFDPS